MNSKWLWIGSAVVALAGVIWVLVVMLFGNISNQLYDGINAEAQVQLSHICDLEKEYFEAERDAVGPGGRAGHPHTTGVEPERGSLRPCLGVTGSHVPSRGHLDAQCRRVPRPRCAEAHRVSVRGESWALSNSELDYPRGRLAIAAHQRSRLAGGAKGWLSRCLSPRRSQPGTSWNPQPNKRLLPTALRAAADRRDVHLLVVQRRPRRCALCLAHPTKSPSGAEASPHISWVISPFLPIPVADSRCRRRRRRRFLSFLAADLAPK